MKITRDPITQDAAIEIQGNLLILKDDTTANDLKEKPLQEIIQCSIGPSEQGKVAV